MFEMEEAVRVTVVGFGTLGGAVYVIGVPEALVVAESVPHELPLQPAPESVQRTPRLCRSLRTMAVNCWKPLPAWTLAAAGETATEMRDCAETRGTDAKTIRVKTTKAARIDGQTVRWDFTNMREFPPQANELNKETWS